MLPLGSRPLDVFQPTQVERWQNWAVCASRPVLGDCGPALQLGVDQLPMSAVEVPVTVSDQAWHQQSSDDYVRNSAEYHDDKVATS